MDKITLEKLKQLRRFESVLHGPKHWARVAFFAKKLAKANRLTHQESYCAEVFSWTHDLARVDDSFDLEHGMRGAEYLPAVLNRTGIVLPKESMRAVQLAIQYHSDGLTADDAYCDGILEIEGWDPRRLKLMVGCCWDADRLDLLRLGNEPDPRKMSGMYWESLLNQAKRIHHYQEETFLIR